MKNTTSLFKIRLLTRVTWEKLTVAVPPCLVLLVLLQYGGSVFRSGEAFLFRSCVGVVVLVPLKEGFLLCVQADWFPLQQLRAHRTCRAVSPIVMSDIHATKMLLKVYIRVIS